MNLEDTILCEKRVRKDHVLYDSTYMKCPEWAIQEKQEMD